ncbi:AMP-binding protein [Tenacibaculum amylolyticum]|uniref:AMP-binding protein n=1 Tax=Tenacibaculum amylolyticum TaxID=104269 RepID=UPI00389665E0
MKKRSFHVNFQLNGIHFSSDKEVLAYCKKEDTSLKEFLTDWFDEKEYVIVKTSGSTGTPKPIQLKKEYMKNSTLATGEFFNIKEKTTALLCLSVDYIAGKMMLVRALTLGWHLDIVAPISNPLIKTEKVYDFSAMVPLQLENSLQDIHRIKKLIVGGGVVSGSLRKQLQDIPTKVYATYGMTETITHIAVKKLNHIDRIPNFYKVLTNVQIYRDDRNCLLIKAPKVSDEMVVTNDIVQLVSDTQFEWLGRYDNVINSGGVKLHPEQIEEKLAQILTNRFFVAGIPDEKLGEKLILIIEDNATSNAVEKLNKQISQLTTLHKYEIPKEIYFVKQFIETETKKIQRTKTLELI